jgi:transcriptional regulator with XRE-family HTH domain
VFFPSKKGYFALMTYIQALFLKNLRFYRKKKGLSQLKFAELINISPNYLNAVENGKNFPSLEVIQKMIEELEIMPFQLFIEQRGNTEKIRENRELIGKLTGLEQRLINEIETFLEQLKKN